MHRIGHQKELIFQYVFAFQVTDTSDRQHQCLIENILLVHKTAITYIVYQAKMNETCIHNTN